MKPKYFKPEEVVFYHMQGQFREIPENELIAFTHGARHLLTTWEKHFQAIDGLATKRVPYAITQHDDVLAPFVLWKQRV